MQKQANPKIWVAVTFSYWGKDSGGGERVGAPRGPGVVEQEGLKKEQLGLGLKCGSQASVTPK